MRGEQCEFFQRTAKYIVTVTSVTMKRSRGDQLTGGTKDVNPQLLSGEVSQPGNDVTGTIAVPLPINRFTQTSGSVVTIFELLKVFVDLPLLPVPTGTVARVVEVGILTKNPQGAFVDFEDPSCITLIGDRIDSFNITGAGVVNLMMHKPYVVDLTDGAGHGVLIGTDTLYVQIHSTNTQLTNTADFKLLYRFKTVALGEYIGIVQSQQ